VPAGVTSVTATVAGARGGEGGHLPGDQFGPGGRGAVVSGTLAVSPGETLTIVAGSVGANGAPGNTNPTAGGTGFASGGAGGGGGDGTLGAADGDSGGGGGGASAVYRVNTDPLVVAGGGGGGGGRPAGVFTGPGGAGGDANAGGAGGSGAVGGGSGGTCCSTASRPGLAGGAGNGGFGVLSFSGGGGGGGGGGFNGGNNGGGGTGGGGGAAGVFELKGGGGGGAGGQSWLLGSLFTPTQFNNAAGQVTLVFQANTTTALTSSLNPSFEGQPVTFTATVSAESGGTPTGTVTFFDGDTPLGGPVPLDASGVAAFTTSGLAAGNHQITAVYSGSADHTTSTSEPLLQTVNPVVGGLQLVATADPVAVSAAGQTIDYTATVTNTGTVAVTGLGITDAPVAPAGPVLLTCSPTTIDPGGVATCTGTYTVTAADIAAASGEIFRTLTATGINAVNGTTVESNPFAVSVDVRVPQDRWVALLVNTTNTIGLTL
jgi:uncharacterized repeat protein (TIGR01451 family)